MVHLDLMVITKKLSVLILFSFLILLSFFCHLSQGQAPYLDGKLNVTVTTDRPQIAQNESLILYVQVKNAGVADVTNINVTLALPEGFESSQIDTKPLKNDLIPNETDYESFRINTLSNVTPNNYTVKIIVNSSNTSIILSDAPPIIIVSKLGSSIDRTIPSTVLQTLIFVTILGGFASAAIAWYFNNRAKDKETYIKSLDELKNFVFDFYIPLAGYAKSFAIHLKRVSEEPPDDLKRKYSFYLLAIYFSYRLRFHSEKGGVIKLQSYEEEHISEYLREEGRRSLPFGDYEVSVMQKYVPYHTKFLDFLKILKTNELMNVYVEFERWIIGNKKNEVCNVIESFYYYGEHLEVQTTLMFSSWYNPQHESFMWIASIFFGILAGLFGNSVGGLPMEILAGLLVFALAKKVISYIFSKAELSHGCKKYIKAHLKEWSCPPIEECNGH